MIIIGILWGVITLINIVAWLSSGFCNFYADHIFPIWVGSFGRISGLFPFSVGEWMLYLGAVLVLLSALLWIPFLILRRKGKVQGKERGRGFRIFYRSMAIVATAVAMIMTLNCTILYHCSSMQTEENFSYEELLELREFLVDKTNELSAVMPRDEQGMVVYQGDMKAEAIKAIRALSDRYPRLKGYYSRPKPFWASWFFSQQYMCGYYFPFSLEANYNDMMYIMNVPYTMCHELSHLKGYLYEDEANYLAYLACIESEDEVFEYSGYLQVLLYVEYDLKEADKRREQAGIAPASRTPISDAVKKDSVFLTEQAWKEVEAKAILPTKDVKNLSEAFLEANQLANGIEEGIESYTKVVELLLSYYRLNGYS